MRTELSEIVDQEKKKPAKLLLVCSSGGHFYQLFSLKEFWRNFHRVWVTFEKEDTGFRLEEEEVYWAYSPTNRNIKNLIKNFILAARIIRWERPDMIVSTGAGVAVPFLFMGKLFGCKTVYIESLTRVNRISLSGKLVYHVVDEFLVQWEPLAQKYVKAKFSGRVL